MGRKSGSHAETTRPRVRDAALRLMAQYGYAAVSMRQIGAEVGLQAGALYSYTADKQSLLADLLIEHLEARQLAWGGEDPPEDPLGWVAAFAMFHLHFTQAHPDATTLLAMELRNLNGANLARVHELNRVYRAGLVNVLSAGAQDKQFQVPEPDLAAQAVLHLLDGAAQYAENGGQIAPERLERISWNMVRRAIGARGFQ